MKDLLFIETMCIADGRIANIDGHIARMCGTVREVYGTAADFVDELRRMVVPTDARKCRIVYGKDLQSVEFGNYQPRKIASLRLVEVGADFDYHLKYADRTALNSLLAMRGDCDEILIVKDGCITDTSFSNVVLTDGEHFVTPETCLLPGTMRAALLHTGKIAAAHVTVADLSRYTHIHLINAMLPLGTLPPIPLAALRY
jgi:4-amino-4-deoxychorismate lyase